jgi:cytochrome c peroxidase
MKRAILSVAVLAMAIGAVAGWRWYTAPPAPWTDAEIAMLRSLWIGSLPPLPPDPTNAVADDERAARFGQRLFFDLRLSGNGAVSCATCHQPARRFTDGLPKAVGIGTARRNTRSIVGSAYSPWQYWDGRRDSLWSQALTPLETPVEQGGDRAGIVALVAADPDYRSRYEALFGPLPASDDAQGIDRAFANLGKAMEAYERLIQPGPSRFDAYVEAVIAGDAAAQHATFSDDEIRGLRLFIGEANCTQCHNGPLFTNNEFHNTGVIAFPGEVPDKGRVQGVREVLADPFNCAGEFSDDPAHDCPELDFARTGVTLIGAMRTPSLRNLGGTEPYMHEGQFATLADVLKNYNQAPLAMIGHNEAKPLGLSSRQLRELEAFLKTLDAPLATPAEWLAPPPVSADGNQQDRHQ